MTLPTKDDMTEEEMANAVAAKLIEPLRTLLEGWGGGRTLGASGGIFKPADAALFGGACNEYIMPRKSTETI